MVAENQRLGKSLDTIVKEYSTNVKNGVYADLEKIANGKMLYEVLRHELHQIRKTDSDLVAIIVDYLFGSENKEIDELAGFFEQKLK